MYPNPLITIPRLQHSPNQAGYSHSHPHSTDRGGAVSGSFQGSDTSKKGGGRGAPPTNYKKAVLQKGVGDPRNKTAPSITGGWGAASDADLGIASGPANPNYDPSRTAFDPKFTSGGAVTGALGSNVGGAMNLEDESGGGWSGAWGGLKGFVGDVAGGA